MNEPEFEIRVSRFGNVGVFRRLPDGDLQFWTYARSIERAITEFRHWPVTIVCQGA